MDNNKTGIFLKLQYCFPYFLIELMVNEKLTWNEESPLFFLNSRFTNYGFNYICHYAGACKESRELI